MSRFVWLRLFLAMIFCVSAPTITRAEEDLAMVCPRVAFLGEASSVTHTTQPGSTDPRNVIAKARLTDIGGGCDYKDDKVTVDVDINIVAERGPALTGSDLPYQYFVVVLDPQKNILAKQEFDTSVHFADKKNKAGTKETLVQTIPIASGGRGDDYTVLIGFQLTEDQLAYNRAALKK